MITVNVEHTLYVSPDMFKELDTEKGLTLELTLKKEDCFARGDIVNLIEIDYHIPTGNAACTEIVHAESTGQLKAKITLKRLEGTN